MMPRRCKHGQGWIEEGPEEWLSEDWRYRIWSWEDDDGTSAWEVEDVVEDVSNTFRTLDEAVDYVDRCNDETVAGGLIDLGGI